LDVNNLHSFAISHQLEFILGAPLADANPLVRNGVTIMSPLDAFRKWFDSQPPEIHQIASFILAGTLPIPGSADQRKNWMTDPVQSVESWLAEEDDIYMRTVGKLLTIRALVSYYIVRGIETPEDWKTRFEFNTALSELFQRQGLPDVAFKVKQMTEAFPRLIPAWQSFAKSWRQLCSGALSDTAIASWADIQILGGQKGSLSP
jgi:hypothetical protein